MIRERLDKLREGMKASGIDCYLVPTSDYHDSEYVSGYFAVRRFFTGFTGSAGTLVVTKEEAATAMMDTTLPFSLPSSHSMMFMALRAAGSFMFWILPVEEAR